ncbi:hypothetical protein COO91_09599 (plasmid) [Nostoc flagelliforme CCNUN1]|uniref:Uncharacterized protein n=1 Tax=Nostoc flagelliforme CCNUN1 TaxID=2038116 RepID=A0A2K8T6X6_9NOSO|nr:hypothetical protein [Nostoc flagelliforme]AUB43422.1 hypothetical protein COO91_09599 [Nostoc flagelliforme CCNUN1]
MVEVWRYWEFEHPSSSVVRVIATPTGLELFAVDVLQIVAPILNDDFVRSIEVRKRLVMMENNQVSLVSTLSALSIHSLISRTSVVEHNVVRQFMQWVRTNVMPVFKNDVTMIAVEQPKYLFQEIDYSQKDSLIKYLYFQNSESWSSNSIDLYLKFIFKKLPLPASCPQTIDLNGIDFRRKYFQVLKTVLRSVSSYEYAYEDLVIRSENLLIAQSLDLLVYYHLNKLNDLDLNQVLSQGLILQALGTMVNKSIENFKDLKPMYLNLLDYFSAEMLALD